MKEKKPSWDELTGNEGVLAEVFAAALPLESDVLVRVAGGVGGVDGDDVIVKIR